MLEEAEARSGQQQSCIIRSPLNDGSSNLSCVQGVTLSPLIELLPANIHAD
jgi:hypothetical protein